MKQWLLHYVNLNPTLQFLPHCCLFKTMSTDSMKKQIKTVHMYQATKCLLIKRTLIDKYFKVEFTFLHEEVTHLKDNAHMWNLPR
jgi:hypothetical protein